MGSGGSAAASTTMDRGSAAPSGERVQDDKAAPSKRTGQSPSGSDRNQAQTPRGSDRDQAKGERSGQRDRAGQRDGQRDGERTGQRDLYGQGGRQGDRARENTGSAPSNANVTGEQRTQIKEKLGSNRQARVTNVNFNVSVGVRVPRSVRLYTLPAPIVEIVPAYRGYKYVIVEDEIIIIHPRTLESSWSSTPRRPDVEASAVRGRGFSSCYEPSAARM